MDIVGFDLSVPALDGSDNVTLYLLEVLNSYPDLPEEIRFQSISSDSNFTMVPTSNVAILTERVSITGHVVQTCQYGFEIFRKAKGLSETNQIRYKEFLDKLGLWIQQIDYPAMAEGMEMQSIKPNNSSALYVKNDNQDEAWMVSITATYTREFDK